MKEQKNIDRLFQEKFKDFDVAPRPEVWDKIAFAKAKKQKKRLVPIWWRLGGVAALLALLLAVNGMLNRITPSTKDAQQLTQQDNAEDEQNLPQKSIEKVLKTQDDNAQLVQNQTTQRNVNTSVVANKSENNVQPHNGNAGQTNVGITQKENSIATSSDKNQGPPRTPARANTPYEERTTTTIVQTEANNAQQELPHRNPAIVAPSNTVGQKEQEAVAQTQETTEKEDLTQVAENIKKKRAALPTQKDDTPELPENKAKWSIAAQAAPVYYSDFGGSGIDPQFSDNQKSGNINASYGVRIAFEMSDKLSIRTGINSVNLSYDTQDIAFTPSAQASEIRSINYNDNARFLDVSDASNSGQALAAADEFSDGQGGNASTNGALVQSIGYLEIPLEAAYVISDKKLGVSVIGGFSTLLLDNNSIALETEDGLRTPLGNSNSLNDLSFTGNLGLGVDYKISDKVKLNVEPTLKYQLNAFRDRTGNFRPYFVGVYTGISYSF